MKLAVALKERADLKTAINELGRRLNNNARVQEGVKPTEDPMMLLALFDASIKEYETLVCRISLTNASTVVNGKNLNQLLSKRDALEMKIRILKDFLDESSRITDRYTNREVRITNTVEISELRKSLDRYSRELRETDNAIQEINWSTELL